MPETGSSQARLEALLETNDGFELADRDLEIRGEGQVLGARQAGVPDLKLARLARDREALAARPRAGGRHARRRPGLCGGRRQRAPQATPCEVGLRARARPGCSRR